MPSFKRGFRFSEQSKVKICLLMMKPCNFLIMDETTNHLDALAKGSLKTVLEEFEGKCCWCRLRKRFSGNGRRK